MSLMTNRKTAQAADSQSEVAIAPGAGKFDDIADEALRRALEKAGTRQKLGADLSVTRQMVHRWDKIPARLAPIVETLYGIPREITAPEFYKK